SGGAEASFILGGQIAGQPPEIYLIYPQGNYISASPETPYLQIGENKYGKPILDRIITPATSLEDAARCALVSLESTIRSNISVGPPIELAIHTRDSIEKPYHQKLTLNSPMYKSMQKQWHTGMHRALSRLPRFDWEVKQTVSDD
ncbi:MAG: peptidase, partial [Burkholderiales bacterium]|nr:peptidase [Burkholderiales bacterium]